VVSVADLISPPAEPASGKDATSLEEFVNQLEVVVSVKRRNWVCAFDSDHLRADEAFHVASCDEAACDKSGDRFLVCVHGLFWLAGGLADQRVVV